MNESAPSPSPTVATRDEMELLRSWAHRRLGLSFTESHEELFSRRIEDLAAELGISMRALHERLTAEDHHVLTRFAEVVSTNHTSFFREPQIFDYLRDVVLPKLPAGPLRFWSAASSSGEEAYSIAMLLRESLGPGGPLRARVLGTDISRRSLATAERGVYANSSLEEMQPERLNRWFTSHATGQFEVTPEVRSMCTFRRLNLNSRPWPFEHRFNVVFLRNVLYYFDQSTSRSVLEGCYDATAPGGWLVTSLTEPMLEVKTRWTQVRPAIYRRGAP